MNLYVGTSGFGYKEWKGKFYPKEMPANQMLEYYSGQFGAVEINHTFRKMPVASVLKSWTADVPKEFKLL